MSDTPYLVADLGATHLRIAFARGRDVESPVVRKTAEIERDAVLGVAPGVVAALAETWQDLAPADVPPAGVGVGVAAYVSRDGAVLQERPFGLLPGTALRDGLAAAFHCPVGIDNDANLAALGELAYGAGRGHTDFLLITLGTNIGLGIVADGRVIRGAHGAAGEAGMVLVPAARSEEDRRGRVDAGRFGRATTAGPSGYAWLEDLVGGGALARSLAPSSAGTAGARVFVRAAAGDQDALAVVDRGIEGWAMLIADLVALFDPECIVLSGGLVDDLRPFIEPLRRRAAELSPLPSEIRFGELGAHAGLVGAAVAARMAVAVPDASPGPARATQLSHPGPDQRPVVTRR